MDLLIYIGIWIATAIVAQLLKPKVDATGGPGDFRPPQPREGEPIPVVFGTVKISPAVTWFGDVEARKLTVTESRFLGLISTEIPVGYAYFAGMQLVLCHGPIDEVLNIHIGEYSIIRRAKPRVEGTNPGIPPNFPYTSNTDPVLPVLYPEGGDPTRISLNMPRLFGGPEEGGGIVGAVDIHWGSQTQGQNDYLALRWGPDVLPQYRGVSYVVLRKVYLGKSPTPEPWHFIVRRIPNVLGQSAYAEIIDDEGNGTANAAECIYELLTNDVWGVGLRAQDIDITTFQAAGQALWNEDLGYCGQLVTRDSAWTAIRGILAHINAVLYQDPISGLLGLKLIREDYSIPALPEFTESNSVMDEFQRGNWGEIINETSVNYTDIGRRFSDGTVQAQNLAAIQAMGGEIVSQEIDLPGLTTFEAALKAASRANRSASVPLTRGVLVTNRYAYALHQGSPFKITFSDYGISELVARVVTIDYGSLTEGRIRIEWIEDPFNAKNPYGTPSDLPENAFCGPLSLQLSGYDPSADAAGLYGEGEAILFETPYWHSGASIQVFAAVSRQANTDQYWLAHVAHQSGTLVRDATPRAFHAVGLLENDLDKRSALTGAQITVRDLGDMETLTSTDAAGRIAGERLAIIDPGGVDVPEIVAWEWVTDNEDGTFTIGGIMRGVLDTVPLSHSEGSRIYFYWNESGAERPDDLTPVGVAEGDYIQHRPVRVDVNGSEPDPLTVDSTSLVVQGRSLAPLPPGNVILDSGVDLDYPIWPLETFGDVTLEWTHRNRSEQTAIVAQDDATAYTLEGTLTIEVLIRGRVVRAWQNVTGTSQAYPYATYLTDLYDTQGCIPWVQFRITPVGAGGEVGTRRVTPRFQMSP